MDLYLSLMLIIAALIIIVEFVYTEWRERQKKKYRAMDEILKGPGIKFKELIALDDNRTVFVVNDRNAEDSGTYYITHEDYGNIAILRDVGDYQKEYILSSDEDMEILKIRIIKPKVIRYYAGSDAI